MSSLILYLAVTIVGYLIGSKLKNTGISLPWIGRLQTGVIVILVFLMGSRIGANEEIIGSLDSIGLISFVYTIIVMGMTCLAFTAARRLLGFDRYGIRQASGQRQAGPGREDGSGKPQINSMTILIVAFVALGVVSGYLFLPDGFIAWTGLLLTICLCILLVLIGIDIGTEGTLAANFRNAGWRVILFPFVSMAAMFAGSVLAALILPIGLQDSICVGSGLGWYSLAPAMLAEYSTEVSALSFMHNVFREIIGILLIPVVARRIGYIESFSLPGSPSMDVCLPVVERATSGDVAVYSFINGAVLSASVPVLVSIVMNI